LFISLNLKNLSYKELFSLLLTKFLYSQKNASYKFCLEKNTKCDQFLKYWNVCIEREFLNNATGWIVPIWRNICLVYSIAACIKIHSQAYQAAMIFWYLVLSMRHSVAVFVFLYCFSLLLFFIVLIQNALNGKNI